MTTSIIKAKQTKLQALEMEQIELIQKLQQQLSAANEQRLIYSGAIRLAHEMISEDEAVPELEINEPAE
jgi:hypothetical protein